MEWYKLHLRPMDYRFPKPLTEGIILERPNRFIMIVQINEAYGIRVVQAHCPNTGKIGSIKFRGIPVLMSYHGDQGRKLDWTAEAISLDRPETKQKYWIGINTGATNRYVEHFLKHGMLNDIVEVNVPTQVKREQKLGDHARIDFKVKDTFIEVKTWTQIIEKVMPDWIEKRDVKLHSYSASDRLVKHANELTEALKSHEKCVMLGCYQYVPDEDEKLDRYDYGQYYSDSKIIREAFDRAHTAGVENWTCTMDINAERVKLVKYWKDD